MYERYWFYFSISCLIGYTLQYHEAEDVPSSMEEACHSIHNPYRFLRSIPYLFGYNSIYHVAEDITRSKEAYFCATCRPSPFRFAWPIQHRCSSLELIDVSHAFLASAPWSSSMLRPPREGRLQQRCCVSDEGWEEWSSLPPRVSMVVLVSTAPPDDDVLLDDIL